MITKELDKELRAYLEGSGRHPKELFAEITKVVKLFPEELLKLEGDSFILAFLLLDKETIIGIPSTIVDAYVKKALSEPISKWKGYLFLPYSISPLPVIDPKSAARLILKLVRAGWMRYIEGVFNEILTHLSEEEFREVASKVNITITNKTPTNFVEIYTEAKLDNGIFPDAINKVSDEFIAKNINKIYHVATSQQFIELMEKREIIRDTDAALQIARENPEAVPYLGRENLGRFYSGVSSSEKKIWVLALDNPEVVYHPKILLRALKNYTKIKSSVTSSRYNLRKKIKVPDEVVEELSIEEVAALVEKSENGRIGHLLFNPQKIEEKMVLLAIEKPEQYKRLKGKLIAMIEYLKHGKTVFETLKDFWGGNMYDREKIRKVIKEVASIRMEERVQLLYFLYDVLTNRNELEIEVEYLDLANLVRIKETEKEAICTPCLESPKTTEDFE